MSHETIMGKYPACGKDFTIRTKLGLCVYGVLQTGDKFEGIRNDLRNGSIRPKETCFECGNEDANETSGRYCISG
jgi:hypothetical protein